MIARLDKVVRASLALVIALALLPFVVLGYVAGVINATADEITKAFAGKDEREA